MDSPGQRRGSCGHKMAGFDMHEKCARCRDKGLGKDPCIVGGAICKICDNFTAIQREMLATPQYQIRKDKKAGLLVSPRDVTVLSPVNSSQQPASTAHAQQTISEDDSAHAQHLPGGSDNVSSSDFVSKKDFDKLSDQLDEKFSRFEALLSRGNIFATPKVPVQVSNPPVSDQPFIDPASARTTGPVRFPAVQDQIARKIQRRNTSLLIINLPKQNRFRLKKIPVRYRKSPLTLHFNNLNRYRLGR